MTDLYQALGVPKDSDATTIKRAFRKKASEAHPDKGGDAATMALVNRAHDVLSDPERRSRYDSTGEIGELKAPADEAGELLMAAFASCMDKPEGQFMVAVREKLEQMRAEGQATVQELDAKLAKLSRRLELTTGPVANLAHRVMDQQIEQWRRDRNRIDASLQVVDKAIGGLASYASAEVAPEISDYFSGTMHSSAGRFRSWGTTA